MNVYTRIESLLISIGLLDQADFKWERIAGVWLFCTLGVMALLLVVFFIDILFLDRLMFPVLRAFGIIASVSLFGAVVLYIAAANYWIL
ncbi:MAG: hypothetical protein HKN84_07100 [Gammaproteobacteria bacterium]|nr:hypothetical protein [Gammaproteobacteria bacterium]